MRWILIILLAYILKSGDATASHGMATWDNLWGKPKFARVAFDSSYHHLRDTPIISAVGLSNSYNDLDNKPNLFSGDYNDLTNKPSLFNGDYNNLTNKPNLNLYMQYSDTGSWIATKNNVSVENKAMKDTAAAIRASFPSLSGYVKFTDTSLNIATRYDIFVQNKAMKDSIAALRALIPATDTNNRILLFSTSGRLTNRIKVWSDIITPSTATGQTINISSAGFNTVLSASVDLEYSGGLVWNTITARTTSQITCNLYRPNTSLVTILGLNVLQGVPFLTANDLSNMRLHVTVIGY